MGRSVGQNRRVGFARWRSDLPSGGNRYDTELATRLPALGVDLREYAVTGPWPLPTDHDRELLAELLTAEQDWLVGNIVASAAPDLIAGAVASGHRVTILMHYFPADDPALPSQARDRLASTEAAAVRAASAVVATSAWAAREVASRYGRGEAIVAVPGTDPAELASGSSRNGGPPTLLWLGRLSRIKDPLTFVEALTRLTDLDWNARLVGPDTLDEDVTSEVRARIAEAKLADRIRLLGPQHGAALEASWAQTDLLVHTSRTETYGMVVAEALARGVPSIVPAGTGAVEAQGVGVSFPPGDVTSLTEALRTWLTNPELRQQWRAEAIEQRAHLPTWQQAAEVVASVLTG